MHIDLKLCAKIKKPSPYNHLVSNPISHSIDTSIIHDDAHFTLTPIELIKDSGGFGIQNISDYLVHSKLC